MAGESTDVPTPDACIDRGEPPSPATLDAWSEAEIDRYNDLKEEQLNASAQADQRDLAAEDREALNALESAVQSEDESFTTTVEVGEATLTVTKRLTGELEQKFMAIDDAQEDENLAAAVEALIDTITMLIVDDETDAAGPDYTTRRIWEVFYERNGTEGLFDVFEEVAGPALDRHENLDKFRNDESRGRPRRNR